MVKISKHISYKEATRSKTAAKYDIDNTPSKEALHCMSLVAENIFEPLREAVGGPIYVSSFFRSEELNRKVGGSRTSSHLKGQAIDIDDVLGGTTNKSMFEFIMYKLDFDQLIWEFGSEHSPAWVHVSYVSKLKNRRQVLKAVRYRDFLGRNRTKYIRLA